MTNLSLSASVLALVLGATACLDQTQGSIDKSGGSFRGGVVSGEFSSKELQSNTVGELGSITVRAYDVAGDGTLINSDTYDKLDHGFALELPGGNYKLDLVDQSGYVLETYNNVVVDGDLKLAPQQAAE